MAYKEGASERNVVIDRDDGDLGRKKFFINWKSY
jgi:hypothetical protein